MAEQHQRGDRYTVCCDFDGVIHSYTSPWQAAHLIPDPPVEGAIDWLNEIVEHFDLVIFTTRGSTAAGEDAVIEYLVQHGFDPDRAVRVTDHKPPALIYLDDRGWRFEGPGTFPSVEAIHAARPWNKPAPAGVAGAS